MAKPAWKPKKADLKKIKEMTSLNAGKGKIATALGIHVNTYTNYLKKVEDKERINVDLSVENVDPIKKAINDGIEERIERIKNNCIDSLDLMTRQHVTKEVKRTRRKVLGQDDKMSTILDTTTTRKVVEPNATVVMFTSVNLMPERFQSINKVEVKQENKNTNSGFKMKWTSR